MDYGELTLLIGYQDIAPARFSFNELAKKTFGLDFERWYQSGYWTKQYIPYSLTKDGEVLSNVSVSFMPMNLEGTLMTMVQIGTVMTDPLYRGQGLSRCIMETVLNEWSSKVDEVYVFANDETLDFFPRFGFLKSREAHYRTVVRTRMSARVEKVDMESSENLTKVERAMRGTRGVSRFSMNNVGLVMFYLTGSLKDRVYFDPRTGAYIVANVEGDVLQIDDVFTEEHVDLDEIAGAFGESVRSVTFGFSPCQAENFERSLCEKEKDTTLFVLKNAIDYHAKGLIFPALSRA